MFQIKLVEFANRTNDLLRGILTQKDNSNESVLMCGGFERSTTTEKKFKIFADKLAENNISSLRFDCTGCGLSDGDFSKVTAERMASDARSAFIFLQKESKAKNISVVCHSLSACAIASLLNEIKFEKIILIAPALNQKDLLRYWFAKQEEENKKSNIEINWSNFKNYLDEDQFQKDCLRIDKMTKFNYISSAYYLENKNKDYTDLFKNIQNVLLIRGNKDDKVPIGSLNIKFKNEVIVKGGDHDLERPDMFEQWIQKAVNFIK